MSLVQNAFAAYSLDDSQTVGIYTSQFMYISKGTVGKCDLIKYTANRFPRDIANREPATSFLYPYYAGPIMPSSNLKQTGCY